ncbi:MAG: hypothetical protein GEU75_02045 [Dehalococcoidia bacterium]|nr:hypothetical protein [Dehalococcoidia bacterium]
MAIETSAGAAAHSEEDVGNILLLEHVNVQQPDQSIATLFYLVGMGFTRDPHMMVGLENMWVNLGEQQFHLPTNPAQVLRGHIGLVTPSLDALKTRLESVADRLASTKFAWQDKGDYIDVTCPWGNTLRCYEPDPRFGNITVGMPYVELGTPRGTSEGIALFYQQAMGAPAAVREEDGGSLVEVGIGTYQRLIFREVDEVPPYDNHHIAVYLANMSGPYQFLNEHGLVTEQMQNHQCRFKEIIDPRDGRPLFTLEHEVRGLHHAMYRRPLVNRTAGQYLEPRRVGGVTTFGTVM